MPWVTGLKSGSAGGKMQPTQVEVLYKVFDLEDSRTVIQFDTQGSEDRQNPGKQSQTLQFGEESAKELFLLLKRTFNFT